MNRPQGVTILGWLAIVFGAIGLIFSIFGIIASIGFLALGASAVGLGGVASGAALAGGAFFLLALLVWTAVLAVVEVAFGVGALQLKPWAWTLGMVWTWVSVVTNILGLFANRSGIGGSIIGIVVALGILYYLYTEEVKAAFGKSAQMAPSFIVPLFAWVDGMIASNRGGRPQTPQTPGGYQPPQAPSGMGPQQPTHYEVPEAPKPPAPPM